MPSSFLQSPIWQEFQESIGRKTYRFKKKLFIEQPLPFQRNYLYCPRVEFDLNQSDWKELINQLPKEVKKKTLYLKIEPNDDEVDWLKFKNFKLGPTVQPKTTLITDISPDPELVKASFKSKTRYNINLAEKKGIEVEIIESDFEKHLSDFLALLKITAQRNQFALHSSDYYSKMLASLAKNKLIYLIKANFEGQCLAGMILLVFNQQAIYLHGASSNQSRPLMAPYLMHWQAIQFAKSLSCQSYDWWGINSQLANFNQSDDILPADLDGVSRFKLGFGGQIINYPAAREFAFNNFEYNLYRQLRQVQRLIQPKIYH